MSLFLAKKFALSPTPVVNLFGDVLSRHVHSKRQIKRLMAPYHPAFLRKARKNKHMLPKEPDIPTPQFQPLGDPVLLSNGWSQPLVADKNELPKYPFHVRRTKNKPMGSIGFLPVYTKCRNDRTKVTTIVKGVTGDREAFRNELRAVLQTKKPFKLRSVGTVVEVPGNNVEAIKKWLTGLGF